MTAGAAATGAASTGTTYVFDPECVPSVKADCTKVVAVDVETEEFFVFKGAFKERGAGASAEESGFDEECF